MGYNKNIIKFITKNFCFISFSSQNFQLNGLLETFPETFQTISSHFELF